MSFLTASILSLSCTHTFSLSTEPAGATVVAIDEKGNKGPSLGQTPLVLKRQDTSNIVHFEISKEGFEPLQVLLPDLNLASYETLVKLSQVDSAWMDKQMSGLLSSTLNGRFAEIFNLQRAILASQGQNPEVQAMITSQAPRFERVSLWHSLVGNYHFLAGDLDKSKEHFQKAIQLDSSNQEAASLLKIIEARGAK